MAFVQFWPIVVHIVCLSQGTRIRRFDCSVLSTPHTVKFERGADLTIHRGYGMG